MIQFNQDQMGVLGQAVTGRYRTRLGAALAAELPEALALVAEDRRDQQLAEWVEMACQRTERIGVVEPGDVGVVAALLVASTTLAATDGQRLRRWISPMLERPRAEAGDGATNVALAEHLLKMNADTDPMAARLRTVAAGMRRRLS